MVKPVEEYRERDAPAAYYFQPSPDGFKSLDKAKILDGREIWGPLALANGKLVLRDQKQIKCVDLLAH